MSGKDIKTKPKQSLKSKSSVNVPKVAVKSKDTLVNTVKDAKAVMKDTLVKKAVESKLGTEQGYSETQKADTEASESVGSAVYTVTDTAYHKSKTYVQNKIKQHNVNKVKTREQAENNTSPDSQKSSVPEKLPESNEPKTADNQPKTRESQENIPESTDVKKLMFNNLK